MKSNSTEFILYEKDEEKWREIKRDKIDEDLFDVYITTDKIVYVTWSGRILIQGIFSKEKTINIQVGLIQDVSFSTKEINILTDESLIKIDYDGKEIERIKQTLGFSISKSNKQNQTLVGEPYDNFSIYDDNLKKIISHQTETQKSNIENSVFELPYDEGSIIELDLNALDTLIHERKSSVLAIDVSDKLLIEANAKNELIARNILVYPWEINTRSIVSDDIANLGSYLPPLGIVTNLKYSALTNHIVYTTINGHTAIKYWNLNNNKQGIVIFGESPNSFELSDDGTLLFYPYNYKLEHITVKPFFKKQSKYRYLFKHKYSNTTGILMDIKASSNCSVYNDLLISINPKGEPIIWNVKKDKLTNHLVDIKASYVKFISKEKVFIISVENKSFEWNLSTDSLKELSIRIPKQFKKIEFYKKHIVILLSDEIYIWEEKENKYSLKKHLFPLNGQVFTDISIGKNKLYISSGKYNSEKIKLISEGDITTKNENYYVSYIKEYNNNYFFICTSNGLIKFFDCSL